MSKDHPLFGPRLKLKRANEHIDKIVELTANVFDGNPYRIVIEHDPTLNECCAKIKFTGKLPENLYVLIPEVAYHLRSALDQMAVAVARKSGLLKTNHIYFPFAGDAADFSRPGTQGKMAGLPQNVRDIYEGFKPYSGGDNELWAVSKLSNLDKHTEIIPIGSIVGAIFFRRMKITGAKVGIYMGGVNRLDDGLVFSILGPKGTIEFFGNENEPNIGVSGHIAFGQIPVFKGEPVEKSLRVMEAIARTTLQKLARECLGEDL